MEQYADTVQLIALAAGAALASGINLYAVMLVLGLLGRFAGVELPPGMELLQHPLVLGAAGAMFLAEFVADKIPGLDSLWDALHTFIRIPAGGLLAAAAAAPVGPDFAVASGILGAGLAASTHATKAGGRLLINTSPEPFSNWGASLGEDALVIAAMWLAVYHPWLFIGAAALCLLLLAWLLPKLWRGVRMLFARIARLFRAGAPPARDSRL